MPWNIPAGFNQQQQQDIALIQHEYFSSILLVGKKVVKILQQNV